MITSMIAATSQFAYLSIPASELREFCDGMFPTFAKCSQADFIRGAYHRYKGGHDIVLDVGETLQHDGISEAFRHFGHIVCTDFPTKAGIPIPFFSQSGLGKALESVGISKGWLNVNICDTGIGVLAIAEGSSDLAAAIAGKLDMGVEAFFDTFVEGSIELTLGMWYKNPFLACGGIENILAGCIATWNRYTYYVDPLDFLGGGFLSAAIGFTVSHYLLGNDLKRSLTDAGRSGLLGGLFVISPMFAYAALAGFVAYEYGKALANKRNKVMASWYSISQEGFFQFLNEIAAGDAGFRIAYLQANFIQPEPEPEELNSTPVFFSVEPCQILDSTFRELLNIVQPEPLPSVVPVMDDSQEAFESSSVIFDVENNSILE